VVEHPVPTREVAGSNPVSNDLVRFLSTNNAESRSEVRLEVFDLLSALNQFSTGRRIGLSPHKHEVAGSSPASGSRCRSSSVVEHVNSQFVSYPSVF
jgi:hypothetical protein